MEVRRLSLIDRLKQRATNLKKEVYALYLAFRDPRVPWYAKAFLALVLAYAFSPIDLIPDFIPVLGYLDDLIIVPAGVGLALKMIPAGVMDDARKQVDEQLLRREPVSRLGAVIVITTWFIFVGIVLFFIARMASK
jgi:uncharacterized membrane protein YkvA (DUF1232 family)